MSCFEFIVELSQQVEHGLGIDFLRGENLIIEMHLFRLMCSDAILRGLSLGLEFFLRNVASSGPGLGRREGVDGLE